jgi:hypothetical protein
VVRGQGTRRSSGCIELKANRALPNERCDRCSRSRRIVATGAAARRPPSVAAGNGAPLGARGSSYRSLRRGRSPALSIIRPRKLATIEVRHAEGSNQEESSSPAAVPADWHRAGMRNRGDTTLSTCSSRLCMRQVAGAGSSFSPVAATLSAPSGRVSCGALDLVGPLRSRDRKRPR